jgi:hypothetical protein
MTLTRPTAWLAFVVLLWVPACRMAPAPSHVPTAWTVVRFEESEVSIPNGWSIEIWRGGSRTSPWAIWFRPPVPGSKPILVNSWPSETATAEEMQQDLQNQLRDVDRPGERTDMSVLHPRGRDVYCAVQHRPAVNVACLASGLGRKSGTILLWLSATEEQLSALGGVPMLAELAARVEDLPYVELRIE